MPPLPDSDALPHTPPAMPPAGPARPARIALVGNPNCGKSSLFNRLTGLRQRTGNFPGVTVEQVSGRMSLAGATVELIDLPGTYSLHPSSLDERVVLEVLLGWIPSVTPDAILFVADIHKLDRHLLLLTQVLDLHYPTVVALNFADERPPATTVAGASAAERPIDAEGLAAQLGVPVVPVSARTGSGIAALTVALGALLGEGRQASSTGLPDESPFFTPAREESRLIEQLPDDLVRRGGRYGKLLALHHAPESRLSTLTRERALAGAGVDAYASLRGQVRETMQRYDRFLPTLREARAEVERESVSDRIDRVVAHPVVGPMIFIGVLLLVFQAIFSWSTVPADLIEAAFARAGELTRAVLPQGHLADLLVDGIIAGLAGIVVFVPQIALLFLLLSLLEEVGYMARAVYLSDRLMQRFGLNGRSLVALTSSGACAIPAIMSTRTIANPKERLITILVAPLISCSARIPVYAILIGFAVPAVTVWGIFSAQALAFVGIYLASAVAALLAALAFKALLPDQDRSYLMMELPPYRVPVWRNVGTTVWTKTRAFVLGAGRIILAISIVLWVAATFGPGDDVEEADRWAQTQAAARGYDAEAAADLVAGARLEASYAGRVGRWIEPAIAPLGYDWKIGIALLSSFAAREVFVGTIATLYAIGSADDEAQITERLAEARRPDGRRVYGPATAASLIVFYLFAMQCMSTLAITRRETGTWRWPLVQFGYMTALAYLGAWLTYSMLT